jgi:hypothetical protein
MVRVRLWKVRKGQKGQHKGQRKVRERSEKQQVRVNRSGSKQVRVRLWIVAF